MLSDNMHKFLNHLIVEVIDHNNFEHLHAQLTSRGKLSHEFKCKGEEWMKDKRILLSFCLLIVRRIAR